MVEGHATNLVSVTDGGVTPLYRLKRRLRFTVPAGVDGITIESVGLAGTFSSRQEYLTGGALHAASGAGGVIVTLPHRRRLEQIVVSAPGGPLITSLGLHRLDGRTAADDATATASNSGTTSSGRTFTVPSEDDFTDLRFAMKGTPPGHLTSGAVSIVRVRGYPTGPRIGLADPAHPERPTYFWQLPGEHRADVTTPAEVAPAFQAALQRWLDDLFAQGPPALPVDVLLVLDSDAQASFAFTGGAPTVSFRAAARPSLAGAGADASPSGKLVLRFSDEAGFVHTFPVALPATGTIASATLVGAPSFRGGAPVGSGDVPAGVGAAPPPSDRGAVLEPGRWVAQRILLDRATDVTGVVLAGYALETGTEVRLELRADSGGVPVGAPLASLVAPLADAGQPAWIRGAFPDAITLAPPAAWILATAARGLAIWLGEDGDPAALIHPSSEAAGPLLTESSSLGGLRGIHQLMLRTGSPVPGDAEPAPPFRLELGGAAVSSSSPDPDTGRVTFDLTTAMAGALPPASASARTVEVAVSAVAPGILTLYPPEIRLES